MCTEVMPVFYLNVKVHLLVMLLLSINRRYRPLLSRLKIRIVFVLCFCNYFSQCITKYFALLYNSARCSVRSSDAVHKRSKLIDKLKKYLFIPLILFSCLNIPPTLPTILLESEILGFSACSG